MTPAQLDHLKRLDAHLDALLALAAKRTPGRWEASDNVVFADATEGYYMATCDGPKTSMDQDPQNAAFIAACAGRAEAGWRTTKAAIAAIVIMQGAIDHAEKRNIKGGLVTETLETIGGSLVPHLLAAWPLELLTLP